jgi:SAM-dependent methyltransferase
MRGGWLAGEDPALSRRTGGTDDFDALVVDALRASFEGWDFGFFAGRYVEADPPWDYRELVREVLDETTSLLDLGTGGGELLAELAPLPEHTVATEGFPRNVAVARERLGPHGVEIVEVDEGGRLPLPDEAFDAVINRHEEFDAAEVRRVLCPGGTFVTQQVGGRDLHELNDALGAPPHPYLDWDLSAAQEEIERAGLEIVRTGEAFPSARFTDVGAVVLFLRVAPWQVPDFSVDAYINQLRSLHDHVQRAGGLDVTCHRFLVVARSAR